MAGFGGGGDGGGDGGYAARQAAEEARKADQRARLNRFFGIGTPGAATTTSSLVPGSAGGSWDPGELVALGESGALVPGGQVWNPGGGGQYVTTTTPGSDPEAEAALAQIAGEKTKLGDATRGHYTDELTHDAQAAARKNRDFLARTGNIGGSAQTDTESELKRANEKGAGRIDEEVNRVLTEYENQLENQRLRGEQLIASGAGDDAIAAAQGGMRNALANAQSMRKVDLTSDLFSGVADSAAAGNAAAKGSNLAALYASKLKSFYPRVRSAGGAVTPT